MLPDFARLLPDVARACASKTAGQLQKQRDIMDPNFLRPKTADQLEKQRDNMETFRNLLKNSGTG